MQHTDKKAKLLVLGALLLFLGVLTVRASVDLAAGSTRTGHYDHVQYLGGFVGSAGVAMVLLDTRSGDVWIYGLTEQSVIHMGKLTELGRPLGGRTDRPPTVPQSELRPMQHARLVHPAPATPVPSLVRTFLQDREASLARLESPI